MILPTWNMQKGKSIQGKNRSTGWMGMGTGSDANGPKRSFLGDGNALKLDGGDGYTTL